MKHLNQSQPTQRICKWGRCLFPCLVAAASLWLLFLVGSSAHGQGSVALNLYPSWFANDTISVHDMAWGDMDGDGDLDLAVGYRNSPAAAYLNDGSMLQTAAVWSSSPDVSDTDVAWGDVDGDGDLDLAVGRNTTDGSGGAKCT
jgi:hypothetical protein